MVHCTASHTRRAAYCHFIHLKVLVKRQIDSHKIILSMKKMDGTFCKHNFINLWLYISLIFLQNNKESRKLLCEAQRSASHTFLQECSASIYLNLKDGPIAKSNGIRYVRNMKGSFCLTEVTVETYATHRIYNLTDRNNITLSMVYNLHHTL